MLERNQLPYVLAGVVLMTMQPMLVTLSQNTEGKMDYNPASSTLLTETLKIIISGTLLVKSGQHTSVKFDLKECLPYAIPACIYFVNNNLVFVILLYVNPTTFQLLSQLKTVFTGLLFRVFLGRELSKWQYLAIWQLTAGTMTSHIPLCNTSAGTTSSGALVSFGVMLSIASCLLSAMGGIYSEKLLKGSTTSSIHWQNVMLYGWGCVFNLLGACMSDPEMLTTLDPLKGFNFWACMVVLNNALNGLAISAILKYADNIARVYAHAAAMIVTAVLSAFLFGQTITPQLAVAVAIVGASAVQYNLKESPSSLLPVQYAPIQSNAPSVKAVELGKKEDDNSSGDDADEKSKGGWH